MIDGATSYRFIRGEHRECRVFAEQSAGVISCREAPPINTYFRRAIKISGLQDATLRLFGETNCACAVSVAANTDRTPIFDPRFTVVEDEIYGKHLFGEHIDGEIYFLMTKPQK